MIDQNIINLWLSNDKDNRKLALLLGKSQGYTKNQVRREGFRQVKKEIRNKVKEVAQAACKIAASKFSSGLDKINYYWKIVDAYKYRKEQLELVSALKKLTTYKHPLFDNEIRILASNTRYNKNKECNGGMICVYESGYDDEKDEFIIQKVQLLSFKELTDIYIQYNKSKNN